MDEAQCPEVPPPCASGDTTYRTEYLPKEVQDVDAPLVSPIGIKVGRSDSLLRSVPNARLPSNGFGILPPPPTQAYLRPSHLTPFPLIPPQCAIAPLPAWVGASSANGPRRGEGHRGWLQNH